jgi:hypothetical protein
MDSNILKMEMSKNAAGEAGMTGLIAYRDVALWDEYKNDLV